RPIFVADEQLDGRFEGGLWQAGHGRAVGGSRGRADHAFRRELITERVGSPPKDGDRLGKSAVVRERLDELLDGGERGGRVAPQTVGSRPYEIQLAPGLERLADAQR